MGASGRIPYRRNTGVHIYRYIFGILSSCPEMDGREGGEEGGVRGGREGKMAGSEEGGRGRGWGQGREGGIREESGERE